MDHPVTLEQERKVWTIHQSVNGTTYYYNRATKKSQYEMPECFKTTEEVLQHPDWKEYRTAEGRKFYYNATTRRSCWQLPNQVKEFRLRLEEKRKRDKEEGKVEEEEISQAQKLKRRFIGLLKNKLIGVTTKWDSCIKLCEDDQRWTLLRMGEKKKYFNEYIADLKKISEQEKRAKIEVNKTQFLKMLKEKKDLTSECKMHRVAYDFMADPRWRLLEQHQKQNAFQGYMEQLWQKEKDTALEKKRQHSDAFRQQLERDCLKHNTKWDDARITYKHNEHWKELHPYDRLSAFIDYILEAEKQHDQFIAKEKRLKDRANRCAFRDMLREKLTSGELGYKTKWKQFILENSRSDKRLVNMMDQAGTSAHEIFQFFMSEVREKHVTVKAEIKSHFKKTGFRMTQQTSNAQFKERLEQLPAFNTLLPHHQDYFHRYFHNKIHSKKDVKGAISGKKYSKKEKKTIFKIFKQLQQKDLLRSKYSIQSQMDHVHRSMKNQGYTVTHETIFKYYLAFLERTEEDHKARPESKSSKSSSSPKKKGKARSRIEEVPEESQFASMRKFKLPVVKPVAPAEGEEEGQIKSQDEKPPKKKKEKEERDGPSK